MPPAKSSRDTHHLKQVIKFYETKQYKKALQAADNALKANPTHAEVLAMKGLVLKNMGQSEEGYNCVKKSLVLSQMKSHVCWHVYGLMYKADRDYKNAAKSYMNALRIEPENEQILRDLAVLQVHIRDLKGLLETREKIVKLRPNLKFNWVAFALAYFLNKEYEAAIQVLNAYINTVESTTREEKIPYETSEMLLFRHLCIKELGDYERMNKHLDEIRPQVLDKVSWLEEKGWVLLQLKKMKEASEIYYQLLHLNNDNHEYIYNYQYAKGFPKDVKDIKPEQQESLCALYDELIKDFPNSLALKRIILDFTTGETFKKRLDNFVRPYLQKTIPSLFNALKSLYNDESKVKIIEELFLSYVDSLEKHKKLSPDANEVEKPSTLLWTWQYLAYHYDAVGNSTLALEYIDKAIEHTPTVVELYMCKGLIYDHGGDIKKAAEYFDKARRMDLADRYLNTRATKYFLRSDNLEEAERLHGLFARQEPDMPNSNIFDMQVMWYENLAGESLLRQKEYGKALRYFCNVDKHFEDIHEDQYDFHTYCIRKVTIRPYVEMLRFMDKLKSHQYYYRAAKGIVKTYLEMYDNPEYTKQLIEKSKKEKEEEDAQRKEKEKKKEKKKEEEDLSQKKRDDDKFGLKHLTADPLETASSYVENLLKFNGDKLESHLLAIEVYLRKKNFLPVIQSIKEAIKISPDHSKVHSAIIRFFKTVENEKLDESVQTVLGNTKKEILGDKSLSAFNDEYLQKNKNKMSAVLSVAEMMVLLDESKKQDAIQLITEGDYEGTLKHYIAAYNSLKNTFNDETKAAEFKKNITNKFPLAVVA